jgi:hypothetical protein
MTPTGTRREDICEGGNSVWEFVWLCEGSRGFLRTVLDWALAQIWIRTLVCVTCRSQERGSQSGRFIYACS